MPIQPPPREVMKDFPGLILNQDRYDLPSGASPYQVNITCVKIGELQVRGGMAEVTFDPDT